MHGKSETSRCNSPEGADGIHPWQTDQKRGQEQEPKKKKKGGTMGVVCLMDRLTGTDMFGISPRPAANQLTTVLKLP